MLLVKKKMIPLSFRISYLQFMKKFVISILLISISFCLFAQENTVIESPKNQKQKKISNVSEKPVLFKDRVVLDFMTSIWTGLGKYEGVKPKAINFGFNGEIIFDLPVKRKSPISFGLGVGVSAYSLYSNGVFGIDNDTKTTLTPMPDIVSKYRKNKLSYTNLHIPIEFRYRHKCGFKISAGVRVGVTVDLHTKYFGPDRKTGTGKELIKDYDIRNRTKIPVEVVFRTGWKFIGVSASYMITKLFESGNGPAICPVSVGISICPY